MMIFRSLLILDFKKRTKRKISHL